jgi:hypothetical protein
MSALPLIATAKADMPQVVMSALPLKADVCGATSYVGYGPIADIEPFFQSPWLALNSLRANIFCLLQQ